MYARENDDNSGRPLMQVPADRRQFNVETCRDIDNVAVHVRWPLTMGVFQGRYYCIDYP